MAAYDRAASGSVSFSQACAISATAIGRAPDERRNLNRSQTIAVVSWEPVKSRRLSGENSTAPTQLRWPRSEKS